MVVPVTSTGLAGCSGSFRYATRHAKTACKKKPGRSGQDERFAQAFICSGVHLLRHLVRPLAEFRRDQLTNSAVSSTGTVGSDFFVRIEVMSTTLTRINRVPRMVRRPSCSPPKK